MRSELDVLLDKVADPRLRADIRSQIERLQNGRTFGLVFESHLPERVRLPEHPVRVGAKVAYLLCRGLHCRKALTVLPYETVIYGEVVALDESEPPSFNILQKPKRRVYRRRPAD